MAHEPTHPVPYNPYCLTERQLDGLACVACGTAFTADSVSVPVGEALGAQVFACTPCAPAEPMSAEAVERDLQRIIDRLQAAIDSHDPAALGDAIKTAEPCIRRVRAWLDERETTE